MTEKTGLVQWDKTRRTVSLRVPRWAEFLTSAQHRKVAKFIVFFVFIDLLMAFVDVDLSQFMRSQEPEIYQYFRGITKVGDSRYWLVPIALILPFLIAMHQAITEGSAKRMLSWMAAALGFVFICIAVSGLSVDVLKVIFGRARPTLWFDEGIYGFSPFAFPSSNYYQSFPSGHSTTLFTIAGAITCFFPRLRIMMLVFASFFAFSRVVIGAHYLSDIIVGGVFGYYVAFWMRDWYVKKGWVFIRQNGVYRIKAPGQLLIMRGKEFVTVLVHKMTGSSSRHIP